MGLTPITIEKHVGETGVSSVKSIAEECEHTDPSTDQIITTKKCQVEVNKNDVKE